MVARSEHWDKHWDKCPNDRGCCIGTGFVLPDLEPGTSAQTQGFTWFVDPALDAEYWDTCPNARWPFVPMSRALLTAVQGRRLPASVRLPRAMRPASPDRQASATA